MHTLVRACPLVLALVSGVGQAQSTGTFLDDLLPQPATPNTACLGDCGCANFGGAWVGACAVNGKYSAQPTNLSIEQTSCHHISINKDRLAVGGMKTYTMSIAQDLCVVGPSCSVSGPETEGGESVADWNKDKDTLTVTAHSGSRLLDRPMKTQQIAGTIRLDGAHLLVDAKGTDGAGAAVTVSCSFEK